VPVFRLAAELRSALTRLWHRISLHPKPARAEQCLAAKLLSGTAAMNLSQVIQDRFRAALHGLVSDVEPYAVMVRPTQDPKHGDYQANCAMSLAKALGRKPRDIAQEIVARLDLGDFLEPAEIAGPGFINLRLKSTWIARQLQAVAADERLGVAAPSPPKTFVIDFSSPNVAKPMHVGHLRSTIIGDALARLLRFLGHSVITDNHLGDWGTQFGIMLYGYRHFLNERAFGQDPVRELARIYIHVRGLMKADEEDDDKADPIAEAARQETAKLHAGDPENVRLWELFMPHCMEEIDRIYRRLDVKFDYVHGESFYNPMLPAVVKSLQDKGIAQPSKGAVVIFGEDEPPALIQKRDGAFTYTTSDLATIRYRIETWHPDAILYVVDFRQALHFKNLFAAARRWGYEQVALEHISFGSVLGKDGKPIKTREGGAVELEALLDEAIQRAEKVFEANVVEAGARGEDTMDLSDADKKQIYEAVGLGAVKYADLSQNRTSNYVFDFDKMLAMNGNTATYMQYAYARNRSIFRKGNVAVERFRREPPLPILDSPHERALAVQLLRLEETLARAAEAYQPSEITSYLWDLAKTYSGFFQNCPVLKAEPPALRDSRLLLCDVTARVLQRCLQLLGIRTVERM
jgi:arginyl-tRNA synthetase